MPASTAPDFESPRQISELSRDAQRQLDAANQLIRRSHIPVLFSGKQGAKWHLFLDHENTIIELCAVACGITILRVTGEGADSQLIQQAIATLCTLQQKSGGWTSWVAQLEDAGKDSTEEPLTLDTFYALRALFLSEQSDSKSFSDGIEWLIRTACVEGGWGFYHGGKPFVLPTSYAIRILSKADVARRNVLLRDVINRGIDWLIKAQNFEKGWGPAPGEESSSVHTALSLLALMEAGFTNISREIVSGRNWLLDNHQDRATIFDTYDVPQRDQKGTIIGILRSIKHLNFPEALIVQGLVAAEADLLDARFLKSVNSLLSLHEKDGHWKCMHAGFKQPTYAIMDACIGLQGFVRQIQDRRVFLELSEHIRTLHVMFDSVNERFKQIENRITETNSAATEVLSQTVQTAASLQKLHERFSEFDTWNARLDRMESGLWLFSLATATSRFCTKYRLFSSVFFVLIVCAVGSLVAWRFFGVKSQSFRWTSSGVNAALFLITIICFFYQLYPRKPS